MTRAHMSCYKASCNGEFRYLGDSDDESLYECKKCGAELSQTGVEALAEDDGPLGQLARVLLSGGSTE